MPILNVSAHEINKLLRLIQSNCENEALSHLGKISSNCDWTEISYKHTGDTILHYAARNGLEKVVKYIFENFSPKTVDVKNKDDKTPLHEAAQFSQNKMCEILLNYGADVNALKRADWTPLMLACTKGHATKTVEVLLSAGALVNYKNKDGWTSLHLISREGDEKVFKLLIKNGVDVKMKTTNGRSALHIAALHGNLAIVEILLNLGLDVNERDNCGNSPLSEAVLGNHLDVSHQLLKYGADYSLINNCGYSLVHLAASEGHIEMLEFILKVLKFDINFANKNNLTALHCAARKKKMEAYAYLLKNGASQNILDNYNRTPLEYLNFY